MSARFSAEPCPICHRACDAPTLRTRPPHTRPVVVYPCDTCGEVGVDPTDPGYAFRLKTWPIRVRLAEAPRALNVLAEAEWP